MSAKVGIVQEINDGNFFVKDSSGNTKELKNGDIIYENDVVFSDGSNSSLAQIKIALEGEDIIVLKNGVQQLFDSSLIASTFGNEEMVFAKESLDAMLDSHSDMTNVWSNLNEEGFSDYQDITEEETTAGEEEEEVLEEGSIGQFALRDGALVDVISDLRKKSWVRTQDYREVENNEALEEASLKPLGGIDSITTVTPPSTIPVTPPPVTPPTVTPPPPTPVPIANLSIDDITMYEQDGYMVFTVTLDRPANGNISVNFATSNGTAESGKDYTPTTGVITIPSGSSTAQIRVPINDDYYYENSEQFKVTLTNPTGNVNMVKPVGIGTILDNPPTTEKTPTTNNTPDSGTGTYDSGDTVYVKLVNSATVKEGIDVNDDLKKSTLKHYIQLVDKNGNPVVIPTGKSITVELEYKNILGTVTKNDFKDGDFQEGVDLKNKVTITLDSNSPKDANGVYIVDIKNPAIYDGDDEGLEIYELTIGKITQNGNPFENVVKHPTENTVTGAIYDTTPTDAKIETTEDNSKDLTISSNIKDMFVDNGKGFVKVPENGQVILYDKDKPIGTITYDKGNSKFTFKPYDDYSDYTKSGDIKFLYYAVNDNDPTEFKNVTVEVTPVADAPTITVNNVTTYEDNKNTQEGQHKIALGLIVPSLSKDQTDKNGGAGDHPERNGEITLKFTNGSSVTGAKLFNGTTEVSTINSNNQEIKVVIVKTSGGTDIDTSYHHSGTLPAKGVNVLYLTKDEYKNLKIQHAEDNDTDISINIGVTSYELDDSSKPLSGVAGVSDNKDMTVVILPVTDNISIKWDNINSSGDIDNSKGEISNEGKTYKFNPMNKAEINELDIKAIMSATSGALNGTGGTKGDLDGTEKRIYEITGLPKDTVVTLDNKTFEVKEGNFGNYSVTKDVNGVYTISIPFPDNTKPDPKFEIKLPKFHQGTVEGKITLKVIDEGATGENQKDQNDYGVKDKNGNPLLGVKEDSVNFEINVMPVVIADSSNETIQIAQAIGNEDAGRGNNNVLNSSGTIVSSSGNITDPTKGLILNIEPKGDKMVEKGETATVWIDKVPVGGSMYIYDNSTKAYKLIGVEGGKVYEYTKDSNNEYTEKTELIGGKSDNISVSLNGDGTYKVEIKDYQNLKLPDIELPKFIPPHNDDKDYTFQISGEKVSTAIIEGKPEVSKKQYDSGNTIPMSVIVKNIADEPINTELVDSGDKIVTIGETKYIKATEDEIFYLKDIYENGTPSSFDKDGSEVLSIKITLPDGVTMIDGAKYRIDGNEYVIKSTDLENIKLTFAKNFSGTVGDIKLKYITTETSGENSSKTHFEQTVKLFVTPVADDVAVATSSTIHEDADGSTNKINLKPTLADTDGSETITSVKILALSVPSGYELFLGSADGTSIASKLVDGYYVLTPEEADNIYAKNTNTHDSDSSDNFSLTVVYTVKDTATGTADVYTEYTHTHNVIVKAITDQPTIAITGSTTPNTEVAGTIGVKDSGQGVGIYDSGSKIVVWEKNTEFTVSVKTTSPDDDGSEEVQRIEIHGVPKGVTVEGAVFQGYTGDDSGVWVIYPSDKTLNSDGASVDIKFIITEGANFTGRDMTIKTITKDIGAEEKSVTLNVNMEMKYTYTGPGTGGSTPDYKLVLKTPTIDEEKPFTLKDLYGVSYSAGDIQGSHWAANFTDLPDGTTFKIIDGMTGVNIYTYTDAGGKLNYVVSGSNQNKADIESVFEKIEIITPKDINSSQEGDLKGYFNITGTISSTNGAYAHQGDEKKYENYSINPVTDAMTVAVTADNIDEDGTSNLSITLSNPSDGTKTELGKIITITVVEDWKDVTNGITVGGLLSNGISGYSVEKGTSTVDGEKVTTIYTIEKSSGDFVLDGSGKLIIDGLTYTPASNRDGKVDFIVKIHNKEKDANDLGMDSEGKTDVTLKPVIDMVLNIDTVIAIGVEDDEKTVGTNNVKLQNAVKLDIQNSAIVDKSESFGNIVLDKIPNGFTVWYKDSTGTLQMATNIGQSGTGFVTNPNITPTETTHYNQWLVPQIGTGNALPEIYINAPTNWAGEFKFDATFKVKEQNGSFETNKVHDITGKITPVADGVTIAPTQVNGSVFSWVALQLNANMKDVDGSEVMNLELTGLSASSQFRIKDGAVLNGTQAVWDATNSKWTITGIKYDEINKIQFINDKKVDSVGIKAWTQELDADGKPFSTDVKSTEGDATFKLELGNASTSNFILGKDINIDFSAIDKGQLKNLTTIDLSVDGKNELLNLKLEDILDMGKKENDGKINLEILGTNQDKVSFADSTNWTKSAEATDGYYEYTHSTDSSVKVQIKPEIEQPL